MPTIVGVRFRNAGKIYYFDPTNIQFSRGDGVIVETVRGVEYGKVVIANKEVDEKEIVGQLKPVMRIATEEDKKQYENNLLKREEAMKVCREKIKKHGLDMKLIDVEFTFDNSKVIFYFESEGRVDFRNLAKDLASYFRIRIELRQIGIRDVTKIIGGLGSCGRPCCCSAHLGDFERVSIKMAKIQGLSLNPTKISGLCGRLMCCLKYENDHYTETTRLMPKVGSEVRTPDGKGIVDSINVLLKTVKVSFEKDGSQDVREYKLGDVQSKVKASEVEITKEDLADYGEEDEKMLRD